MVHIYAWVDSFNRTVYARPFHVSAYYVFSHVERDNLLIMENILDYHNRTEGGILYLFFGILITLKTS